MHAILETQGRHAEAYEHTHDGYEKLQPSLFTVTVDQPTAVITTNFTDDQKYRMESFANKKRSREISMVSRTSATFRSGSEADDLMNDIYDIELGHIYRVILESS